MQASETKARRNTRNDRPWAAWGLPAHRHQAEHGGQLALVTALDAAPSRYLPRLASDGQRLLLPDRAQVEVVLQQLPLHFTAPDLDQILQLIEGCLGTVRLCEGLAQRKMGPREERERVS
jgi:hypothetical protein